MAATKWQLKGDYFETCSCDFVCPCVPSQLQATPTAGSCTFAMAFRINEGRYENVAMDDINFIVVGRTPGKMIEGNWQVGLIVDERANSDQQAALGAIVGGSAGGPMAGLAPLIGAFMGIEVRPIKFEGSGNSWTVSVPDMLEQSGQGAPGIGGSPDPIYLDNTGHPAADRFALAHATGSHVHAFGMDWDDDSGRNNAQFAPFNWQG